MLYARSKNGKANEFVLRVLEDGGINCGGQEMPQNLKRFDS